MPSQQTPEAIEAAAKAAVAAAVLPMIEDVTIRPIPPKPSLFPEQSRLLSEPPPAPRAFIPPAPERTVNAAAAHAAASTNCRVPAQAELRAKRGERAMPSIRRSAQVSLLRRLAAVGLGRREDQEEPERMPASGRPMRPPPAAAACRSADRPAAPPRPAMPPLPAQRGRAGVGICQAPGPPGARSPWAGRLLCKIPSRKINSISRPSCAGRRTDRMRI